MDTNDHDTCIIESYEMFQTLFEKYKNDQYMMSRIHQYICVRLPKIFESFNTTHITNQTYEQEMQVIQDTFIQNFLNNNKYFYVPLSEKFFVYYNEHYMIISEDDILHNVLTSISKNRQLISWKKSTKINIMCKIKNNLLVKSIPNSETIQHVIDLLYPTIFQTKTEAKYFLTIVGDAIFKKNTDLFHFIISKSKGFLQELNAYSQIYLGVNILNTFKYKYYDHEYIQSRLVNISENIKFEHVWKPIICQYFIDIICVASHYSIRFNSSDEYILSSNNDDVLTQYTFYLKDKTPELIVNSFLNEYIKVIPVSDTSQGSQISWKNMLYLWKHFLGKHKLPFIIFQQNLKQLVIAKYSNIYNENMDSFIGIYSNYMPSIQLFLQFWNSTMSVCENEYDLEIEEIISIFKRWSKINNISINHITELQVLDLINYYYPETEIEDNKYINKIQCVIWNKKNEIQNALDIMRNDINNSGCLSNISFYETYEYYCKKQKTTDIHSMIVSKQYFEKYILENLREYIIDNSFISSEWLFV